jgi:hypothetical protein
MLDTLVRQRRKWLVPETTNQTHDERRKLLRNQRTNAIPTAYTTLSTVSPKGTQTRELGRDTRKKGMDKVLPQRLQSPQEGQDRSGVLPQERTEGTPYPDRRNHEEGKGNRQEPVGGGGGRKNHGRHRQPAKNQRRTHARTGSIAGNNRATTEDARNSEHHARNNKTKFEGGGSKGQGHQEGNPTPGPKNTRGGKISIVGPMLEGEES